MKLFKKKCEFCGKKIEKGKELFGKVKVPEFADPIKKPFCNESHIEKYTENILGTPSKSLCMKCFD